MSAADNRAMMYDASYDYEGLDSLWGNSVTPVKVLRQNPDQPLDFGNSRIVTDKVILKVRAYEVAEPAENDLVTIGTVSYRLNAEPEADAHREIFTCPAVIVP